MSFSLDPTIQGKYQCSQLREEKIEGKTDLWETGPLSPTSHWTGTRSWVSPLRFYTAATMQRVSKKKKRSRKESDTTERLNWTEPCIRLVRAISSGPLSIEPVAPVQQNCEWHTLVKCTEILRVKFITQIIFFIVNKMQLLPFLLGQRWERAFILISMNTFFRELYYSHLNDGTS